MFNHDCTRCEMHQIVLAVQRLLPLHTMYLKAISKFYGLKNIRNRTPRIFCQAAVQLTIDSIELSFSLSLSVLSFFFFVHSIWLVFFSARLESIRSLKLCFDDLFFSNLKAKKSEWNSGEWDDWMKRCENKLKFRNLWLCRPDSGINRNFLFKFKAIWILLCVFGFS